VLLPPPQPDKTIAAMAKRKLISETELSTRPR
jgi:hypothetical protein